jgi:hypothetical protein
MKLNVLLPSSKIIILEVETSDTIANIKKQVQDSVGIIATENWVLCQGIKLHDTWTFEDYDISDNFQIEFQNIKEARAARKAAKKAAKGGSPVSSSDDEIAPPPPGQSIPPSNRRKPMYAAWRDYRAEQDAKEAERTRTLNRLCSSLTGDYLDDVDSLMALGITEKKAEMLALEMECAMAGVCDWCGRKGGCPC